MLRQKAAPVEEEPANLQQLVDDMFETMYDEPGIGLAAPQVGASIRLVVIAAVPDDEEGDNVGPQCLEVPDDALLDVLAAELDDVLPAPGCCVADIGR